MGIPILDAKSMQQRNQARARRLERLRAGIVAANEAEVRLSDQVREAAYQELLVPFAQVFARLKHVDLAELAAVDVLSGAGIADVEVEAVRLSAVGALGTLAGGAAVGAGAAATTFAAVGAFATASTGTAISTLSGAAATNATLAWLGAGGGMAVGGAALAAIAVVPALAIIGGALHVQGRRACRQQREVSLRLDRTAAELRLAETRYAAARERSAQIREALGQLLAVGRPRVEELRRLVDRNDDFATYTPAEVAEVAKTAALITTTATVMSAPICDADGIVTDLSARIVADAKVVLAAL